ncbi:protein detoxification 35 [Gossypium australe]|uniref:Protein detoxification 35 n=1 Tax=Gossypium australe TaxID=47621 RepID=A0A5B6UVI6_9ROSI|nr:protein detoxification 35 [Gossypium australe]
MGKGCYRHDRLKLNRAEITTGLSRVNGRMMIPSDFNVEFNHPLYLHPSNTPGLVDGTYYRDLVPIELHPQSDRCNAIVLSWILNTVSKDHSTRVIFASSAEVVWTDLGERFNKVDGSRVFFLHREIASHCQGTMSISVYFTKLSQILPMTQLPKVNQAYSMLVQEESQRLHALGPVASNPTTVKKVSNSAGSVNNVVAVESVGEVVEVGSSSAPQVQASVFRSAQYQQLLNLLSKDSSSVPATSLAETSLAAVTKGNISSDTTATIDSSLLCHSRLGHASISRLSRMPLQPCNFLDSTPILLCSVCPLAKQTRLVFPISKTWPEAVFSPLHLDLWGPYRISTHSGHRYFLTIVDDFSRMTWVNMLFPDFILLLIYHIIPVFSANVPSITEPQTYQEAILDSRWIDSMKQEIRALEENGTWEVVSLPFGKVSIGCKWVYKKAGVDFQETFSPVAKGASGNDIGMIDELKDVFHKSFKMKDLGKLKYFLGIEIARSSKGIILSQRKYALELISDAGLGEAKPAGTPLEQNKKFTTAEYDELVHLVDSDGELLSDVLTYQRLMCRLLYLTNTRPNISYAVQHLSQFMQKPKKSHYEAAIHIVRYMKKSPRQGILLATKNKTQIIAYCDSDWAACPMSRRSITGFCIKLGSSLVS